MSNEVSNVIKQLSENALSSAKKVTELNFKAFEALSGKQSELFKSYFELGSKHAEASAKVKDLSELVSLQQETTRSFSEQWVNNLRETANVLTTLRDELASIVEEAVKYTQNTAEQAVEIGKKAATDVVEKTTEAVEKVAADVVEITKDAAEKTVEVSQKVANKAKAT